ncbi:helix-turn-helix transcriptional regulator [Cohnella silvisoli]|uniref:Helix-turn-helix transcriptional regulator n=1 Tax=Cohnella silvisoli TaxID=2873699 RepID=A0ABV1L2C5_9BACL|nr:helix-turn-helix transcriptional regulator [Cohnella silvisoli]MCD9021585.1 helix-turn-helix transcriptional regulator [Cohnella silvisoli]
MDIIELVQKRAPITGEQIAEFLGLSRPTIRSDLVLLVMLGYIDAKPKVGYFIGNTVMKQNSEVTQITQRLVHEVMGIPVVLRETATVSDAVVTLFLENVGSLIVIDASGALAGIVSRKDLLKVTLGNAQASSVMLNMVMTRYPNIVTVSPDDTVREAIRKMISHQVDALPVVHPIDPSEGPPKVEVIGRITKTTITKLLFDATAGDL